MVRERIEVPSLVHGISQLPAPMRSPAHAESEVNCWPTVEHGLTKRPPLVWVGKVKSSTFGTSPFTGKIDRGPDEQYIFLAKLFDASGSGAGSALLFDLAANVYLIQDNLVPTNPSAFLYLGINSTDVAAGLLTKSAEHIRALSVFDSAYIVNRRQSPTMSGSVYSPTRPKGHAYVFIKTGNYGLKYTISFKIGGTTYTCSAHTHDAIGGLSFPAGTTGSATDYGTGYDGTDGYKVWDFGNANYPGDAGKPFKVSAKTQDIAHNLEDKLNSVLYGGVTALGSIAANVAASPVTATRMAAATGESGAVIKIVIKAANTDFDNFSVTTSQGDVYAYAIWNEIDSKNDLPLFCTHDYVVKVKGAISSPDDDFYVKFVADQGSGVFGKGDWAECPQPADPAAASAFPIAISDVTTPHKLTRHTDDGAGTVTGTAFKRYFTFDPVTWDQIVAGDAESNPKSVCIDSSRHVMDIVEFIDRICWLYEDGILASEQGEHLNYFRTSVRSILDKDPIDTKFTADQSGTFHSAILMAGQLVIFGKESQIAFRGTPVLTPTTYEGPQVAKNGNVTTARPATFRNGVTFGMDFGTYIGLGHLTPSSSDQNVFDATDLTQHASAFITAPLRQIEINANSSITAVRGGSTDTIHVLKQHREGDEIRQSAWFSFTLPGATILGMHFFGTKLYIVTEHTSLDTAITFTAISNGTENGLARLSNGTVVSWGWNRWGESTVPSFGVLTCTAIDSSKANLSAPTDMGHSLFLMSNGTVLCAGNNVKLQAPTTPQTAGVGRTYTKIAAGGKHSIALRDNGTVACWGDNFFGQAPPAGQVATTHTHIDAGLYHSAARKSDGSIVVWGPTLGTIGYDVLTVPVLTGGLTYTDVKCGGRHCIGLVSDGSVRCWGSNTSGQCTIPAFGGLTAVKIEAGESHSLALMSDGTIKTWGFSSNGLGTVPTLPAGKTYTEIAGGWDHSSAIRSDGVIVCWGGVGAHGQLSPPSPFGSAATVGVHLGYIDLSPGIDDNGRDYWLHLDRRVTNSTSGVSIVAAAGVSTVTVPYDIEANTQMELVAFGAIPAFSPAGTPASVSRYIGTVSGLNTFTVQVDLTGLTWVAGKKYTCTHNFHKPQVMEDARTGQRLVLDQTSSVIQLAVRYERTSYLELYVGSDVTSIGDATTAFQGPLSDQITAGIGQRLEAPWTVYVSNPTPFPHSIVSAEWLLNVVKRSQPV